MNVWMECPFYEGHDVRTLHRHSDVRSRDEFKICCFDCQIETSWRSSDAEALSLWRELHMNVMAQSRSQYQQ